MKAKEKEVMLAFMKEQQRYNEALTAFCQLMCIMEDDDEDDTTTPTSVNDDHSYA